MFGDHDPIEKENSHLVILADWDGVPFEVLHAQIKDNVVYTVIANVPHTPNHDVGRRATVTGMYANQYEEWLMVPWLLRCNSRQVLNGRDAKIRIKHRTTTIVGRIGSSMYGANTVTSVPSDANTN